MTEERSGTGSPRVNAYDVTRASFTVVRRGFDPEEVRTLLESLGRELEQATKRETELRSAIATMKSSPKPAPAPVLDENTLTAQLGQKSAEVLRQAHDEARRVLEAAQTQAGELLNAAQQRASEVTIDAEQRAAARVGDAEVAASAYEAEALEAAKRLVEKGRADGETLVSRAREQGRGMIDQAQEARGRVLADMNARRRMMHVQIEQLRSARDKLAESIIGVRGTIDRLTQEIANSDDAARAAAEEVARRQPSLAEIEFEPFEVTFDEVLVEPAASEKSKGSGQKAASGSAAGTVDDEAVEPGVVEELFAKIRASAHDEGTPRQDEAGEAAVSSGPDAQLLGARDAAISAARSSLARKVKRTLQDEQNRLLDSVRSGGALVLDASSSQTSRLAAAAVDPLRDAATAGKTFVGDRGVAVSGNLTEGAVVGIAEAFAASIVTPLRRRLEAIGDSEDATSEINAAFREWRGTRLDRSVGDAALEAFSASVVAATGTGTLRWIPAGSPTPCPDCADNGLSGPVPAGTIFPTGQAYPPSHAGCRCAVIPVIG